MPIQDLEIGEQTPLLGRGEKPPVLNGMQNESIKEKAVASVAGAGFITSLLSLLLESHPAVLVSSILGILIAPYAAFQQQKITQAEALRQTNEQMEVEVRTLSAENDRLQTQVAEVQESVSRLESLQSTMDAIQGLQGSSIEKLEDQLVESRNILQRMQLNRKSSLLQMLMTVLIASDSDSNMILSDSEIDDLIVALEGLHGVQLKEDKIRKTILDHGRSVGAIMQVAQNVMMAPDDENMVFFEPEE